MERIKEELDQIKDEVQEIENEGFAMEFIKDYKKTNKRLFIICLVLIGALLTLGCYTIWLLNDIGVEETTTEEYTQDISDTGDINDSNINNGGVINGKD